MQFSLTYKASVVIMLLCLVFLRCLGRPPPGAKRIRI